MALSLRPLLPLACLFFLLAGVEQGHAASAWQTVISVYPAEAMKKKESGEGIVHATTDAKGKIHTVNMAKSTGSKILDDSTLQMARANWQGPPNAAANIPVAYQLPPAKGIPPGGSDKYQGWKMPPPAYPFDANDAYEQGSGLFRIVTNKDGRIKSVQVIRSTGHKRLDEDAAKNASRNWSGPASSSITIPIVYRLDANRPALRPPDGKTIYTPKPYYPYQSRSSYKGGSGVLRAVTDDKGYISKAWMSKSTGDPLLDENTVNFAKAHWSAPANSTFNVPVIYQMRR